MQKMQLCFCVFILLNSVKSRKLMKINKMPTKANIVAAVCVCELIGPIVDSCFTQIPLHGVRFDESFISQVNAVNANRSRAISHSFFWFHLLFCLLPAIRSANESDCEFEIELLIKIWLTVPSSYDISCHLLSEIIYLLIHKIQSKNVKVDVIFLFIFIFVT